MPGDAGASAYRAFAVREFAMSSQPVISTPSSERARRMLERARQQDLVTREQRRLVRQMRAHAASLLRSEAAPTRRARP